MSEVEELSWLSIAYIDAGVFMAQSIYDEDFLPSVHRNLIPLFLVHQGLELMLKSGIKFKSGKYPKTHDLIKLKNEFDILYPELDIQIPECLCDEFFGQIDLFPESLRNSKPLHEMLRYPADRKGNLWKFDKQMDIKEVLNSFSNLNKTSLSVWVKIRHMN